MVVRAYIESAGMIYPDDSNGYFAGLSSFYAELEGFQRQGKDPIIMEWTRFKTSFDEDSQSIYDGDILDIEFNEGIRFRPARFKVMYNINIHAYELIDIATKEVVLLKDLSNPDMMDGASVADVRVVGNQYEDRRLLVES